MNWKGKPLANYKTVIKLMSSTKTRNGLTVTAIENNKEYATKIRHSDKDVTKISITVYEIHPK